jgi:arsenate reductase (thioredoxin)
MEEIGIDISHHQSKDVAAFSDEKFDVVITVCNRAKQNCPVFFGAKTIHWDIPDPETIEDFRSVRDDLMKRIDLFLSDLN